MLFEKELVELAAQTFPRMMNIPIMTSVLGCFLSFKHSNTQLI